MGYMTLADFRTDVNFALGKWDPALSNTFLDRQINFAYMELAGGINFEILAEEDLTQNAATGINFVTVPTGAISIDVVKNLDDDKLLAWVNPVEYFRLPQSDGIPIKWTRHKNKILLQPVPNGTRALQIIYRKYPTRFSAAGDTSVLPDTWDQAIYLLAVHAGLLARGEENRAMIWLNRAVVYITSRMTDEQLQESTRGLGLTLPMPVQKMTMEKGG